MVRSAVFVDSPKFLWSLRGFVAQSQLSLHQLNGEFIANPRGAGDSNATLMRLFCKLKKICSLANALRLRRDCTETQKTETCSLHNSLRSRSQNPQSVRAAFFCTRLFFWRRGKKFLLLWNT